MYARTEAPLGPDHALSGSNLGAYPASGRRVALSDNGGPLRPLSEIVVFRPEPPFLSNCAAMCDSSGLTAMADGPIECILNRSLGFWRNLIESPPCRIAKRTFVSGALLAWPQFCSR